MGDAQVSYFFFLIVQDDLVIYRFYNSIYRNLELSTFEENETIFQEKDKGDKFYIILEGEVKVLSKKTNDEVQEQL